MDGGRGLTGGARSGVASGIDSADCSCFIDTSVFIFSVFINANRIKYLIVKVDVFATENENLTCASAYSRRVAKTKQDETVIQMSMALT